MERKIPLVAIVGPTASGKTALSINLAKKINGEIVSADSMQIYKEMDIATAKPTKDEMQGVKHHLIDFVETDHKFSVAEYIKCAQNVISDIDSRGKRAILVGGTGLYYSSLIDNISFEEEKSNADIREKLIEESKQYGGEFMLEKLAKLDPDYANKLHSKDITRIIRGIEINILFGHTMCEHKELSRKNPSPYNPLCVGITYRDRQKLYDRIDKRVDIMVENGLVDEAQYFYKKLDSEKTAVQAIGYKELFPYLEGKITLDEAIDNLKKATRNYAKRQLTWFRKDERINWFFADEISALEMCNEVCLLCEKRFESDM